MIGFVVTKIFCFSLNFFNYEKDVNMMFIRNVFPMDELWAFGVQTLNLLNIRMKFKFTPGMLKICLDKK